MRPDPSAHAIRIQQVLFGLAVVGLGLMAVRSMMGGSTGNLPIIGGGIILVVIILMMDKKYWMLCPLAYWGSSLISIPLFDLPELGCIAVIGTHFVRRALRQEIMSRFNPAVFFALPYLIWAALAYLMNPSGLFLFGGTTIGARFYFKLLISFWAMIVLSIQQIDEDDCRHLFHAAIALATLGLLKGWLTRSADAEHTFTSMSAYELLGSATLAYWLFSRYRLRQFLQLNWKPILAILLALATLFTGKRRAVFNIGLYPILRAFVARQDRGHAVVLAILGFAAVALLASGQGHLYELPLSVQRSLSVLPGKWDSSIQHFAGGRDPFREIVHEYAREEVRKDPWFGRKGYAIDMENLQWLHASRSSLQYEGHGVSSNWHSTWLGMAADFGVPAAIFWGVFSFGFLHTSLAKLRASLQPSFHHTLLVYYTMSCVFMLLASRTSGHSAQQPFHLWPAFGLILALRIGSNSLDEV